MTRRSLATSLLGLVGSALEAFTTQPRMIRYRLRLDVTTPEGTKSGSSVIEENVRWNDGLFRGLGSGAGIARSRRGEAVIVDLGQRGLLFCLLSQDGSRPGSAGEDLLRSAFSFREWSKPGRASYLSFLDTLNARRPTGVVPLAHLPMLVRFDDLGKPDTVERLQPEGLESAFGQGVKIETATLSITDDPVTQKIQDVLPWLKFSWEQRRVLLKGPLWSSDDPHYDITTRVLTVSFRQEF